MNQMIKKLSMNQMMDKSTMKQMIARPPVFGLPFLELDPIVDNTIESRMVYSKNHRDGSYYNLLSRSKRNRGYRETRFPFNSRFFMEPVSVPISVLKYMQPNRLFQIKEKDKIDRTMECSNYLLLYKSYGLRNKMLISGRFLTAKEIYESESHTQEGKNGFSEISGYIGMVDYVTYREYNVLKHSRKINTKTIHKIQFKSNSKEKYDNRMKIYFMNREG